MKESARILTEREKRETLILSVLSWSNNEHDGVIKGYGKYWSINIFKEHINEFIF